MPLLDAARRWLAPAAAAAPAAPEAKAGRAGPVFAMERLGEPVWSPRDFTAFAREGFARNAVVYRSVRMIAEAAASVRLKCSAGAAHPLARLIARPNAVECAPDFFESWYGYLLLAGNGYAEAVALGDTVRELHVLRPDRIKVIAGADGWPAGYDYSAGGRSVRFAADPDAGVRPILHMQLFHPLSDYYGMSPMEAAATAIDVHNAASGWNKALLDNSARPSGALVYSSGDGHMTEAQFGRLKQELEANYAGAMNAGRPMLLEGGLDFKPLSLSPKDMDFIEAKNSAAREIALALGVPPMLLGIPGDNTYANYAEANRVFWRQTVLPLVSRTAQALSGWLAPAFGDDGVTLAPDLDNLESLAPERTALWDRIGKADFLTRDEKRALASLDATPDAGPLPDA